MTPAPISNTSMTPADPVLDAAYDALSESVKTAMAELSIVVDRYFTLGDAASSPYANNNDINAAQVAYNDYTNLVSSPVFYSVSSRNLIKIAIYKYPLMIYKMALLDKMHIPPILTDEQLAAIPDRVPLNAEQLALISDYLNAADDFNKACEISKGPSATRADAENTVNAMHVFLNDSMSLANTDIRWADIINNDSTMMSVGKAHMSITNDMCNL